MWIQRVPGGGINGLVYSPDGRTLYVADRGGTLTAWDTSARKGQQLFQVTPDRGNVHGIAVAAAGRYLVVKKYPFALAWDVVAGAEADRLSAPTPQDALPVPGGGARVFYRTGDRQSLLTWEPAPRTAGLAFAGPFPRPLRPYDLSSDARTVAFGYDASRTAGLFDVATGRVSATSAEVEQGLVWGVRFALDGRTLAVFAWRHIHLCDTPSLTRRAGPVEIDNRHGERTFAFHPSAPVFVALNRSKHLTLFSSETGSPIRSLDFALGRSATCVAFAPDGLTCAVGGSNKQFAVFDVDV